MEGDGGEHEVGEALWSARCSLATSSAGSLRDVGDDLDGAEDKVFVAVSEEISDGESTLVWALHNLATDGCKIVIAHVHSPAQAIGTMRDHSSMRPEEIKECRKLKRAKAEKNLDAYVLIAKCTREDIEVCCEEVIIEVDSVAKGLDELITLHSITKLVMGAAADQHYSKEMKAPKSKTALKLMETAALSCKIWFTCKGQLICTREANVNLPAIPPSPAQSNAPLLEAYNSSNQMRSMALADLEYGVSSFQGIPSSLMTDWDIFFGDWGMTVYGSSRTDDAIGKDTTLPVIVGDTNEQTSVVHSPTHESDNVYMLPVSACDREDKRSVDEPYNKVQDPCTEVELLKNEADEESNKLRKAEMDLLSALQRIKESEDSYIHEVNQLKEIEKTLATQKLEIEEMKRRRYTLYDELQHSNKHKLMLEQRIIQIKSAAKDYVEEITEHFIKQSCEESTKRQRIEMDLLSTSQRVKEAESLYRNEKTQRENMEEKVARQRLEIEEAKRQRDELYYELQDVKEQKLRLERVDASEETNRRRKAEADLLSALHRNKNLEHWHTHEMKRQEAMEETMARQHKEIQAAKRQLHEAHGKHMTEIKSTMTAYEEKLADSKRLLQELQGKYDKLLHERDTAVTEAEELRQKYKQRAFMTTETLNTEFSFVELQQATQGFDAGFKIGEERFASVYRGFLRNTTVAIKLLDPQSLQGEAEFHEQVAAVARVRHSNIVTLLGECPEAFALLYEFLPNGNLEDWLPCKKGMSPLTWKVRTRIIGEICSALAFIHSHKPVPIVHGDLNLGNILLDTNFISKLGDLGICPNQRGTLCCMDRGDLPSTRELMLWPDVHAFGIIILCLLTGRSPQGIAEIVEETMENEHLHSIMDASAGDWPFVQANQLAHLGLRCVNLSGGHQPDLTGEVWVVIESLMKTASLPSGPSQFASSSDDTYTPSYFICPIFQEVMSDPHMAADGFTYESESIRGWLNGGSDTSPMTNLKLAHRNLTPNRALRSAILEWQQQQHGRRFI